MLPPPRFSGLFDFYEVDLQNPLCSQGTYLYIQLWHSNVTADIALDIFYKISNILTNFYIQFGRKLLPNAAGSVPSSALSVGQIPLDDQNVTIKIWTFRLTPCH